MEVRGARAEETRARIVAVEDRHVAAMALRAREKAAGGRVRLRRRDDLDEHVADRPQRVLEPVFADRGIAKADVETENEGEIARDRLQRRRDEDALPRREFNVKADRAAIRARRIAMDMVDDETSRFTAN